MKIKVHGKDLTVSQDMVERIAYKLSFLDKYILIDDETTAQVIVKKHGNNIKLEVTVPTKVGYLRSEVIDKDIRNAIDDSIDKLEDQLRRQKTRLSRRHKEKLAKNFISEDVEEEKTVPVRVKRVPVEEMDVEEAIMQMELLDHSFFIFKDYSSGVISVVYKREEGGYGVIEAQSAVAGMLIDRELGIGACDVIVAAAQVGFVVRSIRSLGVEGVVAAREIVFEETCAGFCDGFGALIVPMDVEINI